MDVKRSIAFVLRSSARRVSLHCWPILHCALKENEIQSDFDGIGEQ